MMSPRSDMRTASYILGMILGLAPLIYVSLPLIAHHLGANEGPAIRSNDHHNLE
jgi:hypothetical protein